MQKVSKKIDKRVLFVTSTFPTTEKDTLAPWIGELVRKLKSAKIAIEVFAPSYSGIPQSSYYGISVYRFRYAPAFLERLVGYEGALTKLRRNPFLYPLVILYIFFGLINFIKILTKTRYDVVHIHWPFPHGIFVIFAKPFISSKIILTFYGAEFPLADKIPFGKVFLRFIINQANIITAISHSTKSKVQQIKSVPVTVIPFTSGISGNTLNLTNNNKKKKNGKKILFVGRLIERKGVSYLIDAIPMLSPLDHNMRLDIVGQGPLYTLLKKKIDNMNLRNTVFLHGNVSKRVLKNLYRECDIFVLPAITDTWGDTEGLGVVILEAMSFGKPVVASRVGGISDIVKHNVNGLLVTERDSKKLADAIQHILQDENMSKRLGLNGFSTVCRLFDWNSIFVKIRALYQ